MPDSQFFESETLRFFCRPLIETVTEEHVHVPEVAVGLVLAVFLQACIHENERPKTCRIVDEPRQN